MCGKQQVFRLKKLNARSLETVGKPIDCWPSAGEVHGTHSDATTHRRNSNRNGIGGGYDVARELKLVWGSPAFVDW